MGLIKRHSLHEILNLPEKNSDLDEHLHQLWNRDIAGAYLIEQRKDGVIMVQVGGVKTHYDCSGKRIESEALKAKRG